MAEKEKRISEMAEADRHQEEELEEERKRADSMTTARDNGINKFYKEYRWSGGPAISPGTNCSSNWTRCRRSD